MTSTNISSLRRPSTLSPPGRGAFDSARASCTNAPMAPPARSLTVMTGGSADSSGLNGRASHARNPQTRCAGSGASPIEMLNGSCPSPGRQNFAGSGASRMPGALDIACASPCGKTMTSPAAR